MRTWYQNDCKSSIILDPDFYIIIYSAIFRECPMSLEAAQGLLSLGIKGAEVATLMMNGLTTATNTEWLVLILTLL